MVWSSVHVALAGLLSATVGVLAGATQGVASLPAPDRPAAIADFAMTATSPPKRTIAGAPQVLRPGADGLFHVEARVNGIPVRFIIDTGANVLVLSARDAARVGLVGDRAAKGVAGMDRLSTAAGSAGIRWTQLQRLDVAGHALAGVDAAVPDTGADVSLLGRNVLSQLGMVMLRGDTLTIG